MVIHNYHWLNSESRVLILTCSTPLVQTKERKQTHTVYLDPDLQSQASQGQDRAPTTNPNPKTLTSTT